LIRLLKTAKDKDRERWIWKARRTSCKTKIHWKNERNERFGRKPSKKSTREKRV